MHSTWKLVGLCPIRLLTNCSSGTAHMSSLWNKFQKFRFSAAELGKVRMSDSTTMDDRTTTILKATADTTSMNSTTLPSVIEPAGMSRARADYLYKQIRPHCHEENRDITCPDPSEAMEEWCSCFFSVLCSQHTIHCIFYDNTNLSFTFLICFWCNYGFLLWLHNLCTFCKFCTFDLPVWNELYVWKYWLWVSQILYFEHWHICGQNYEKKIFCQKVPEGWFSQRTGHLVVPKFADLGRPIFLVWKHMSLTLQIYLPLSQY